LIKYGDTIPRFRNRFIYYEDGNIVS